ncbi:anaerobic sulfatase maturase [Vagococcus sp. PNs007]|uniref:Anaerobic sulfatase maturase n=1 Tax=Vagococcus proximus TaxID=2991417 RepID=A0ABT5WZL8_9ENTE|nr:anaerobic sulfatase maturase [Vagococcus proximus]MDF0479207.1 anaerobic sulfatase maturase [Vagococcus proximus]
MKQIAVLVKPSSSLCNIRCQYCFYADVSSMRDVKSFGKMTSETTEKMIENIFVDLEDGDDLSIAFQGGEPTLAGLKFFNYLAEVISVQSKKVTVNYSIQTNGLLLNEKWCEFFKEHRFLVGLSIDGTKSRHDAYRIDTKGEGTFNRVLGGMHLLRRYDIPFNILCVVSTQMVGEANDVYNFLQEEKIEYCQFIPCLDELKPSGEDEFSLKPEGFYAFYNVIFNRWYEELKEGSYRSIKLFDDIINLLVLKKITACGIVGNCQIQYVIEADGSVYPCDFYVLDEYRLGYIQESSLRELFSKECAKQFICERKELPELCLTCPFRQQCHGGCKRMKDAVYVDKSGRFCGYQEILKLIVPKLPELVTLINDSVK